MSELVVGWVQKDLGNLVTFKKGKKVETSDELSDGYLRYLGAAGLEGKDDGYGLSDNGVIANKTDVLMLWDGERSGLVGHKQFGVVSSTVSRLRPVAELIDPTFLYYSLLLNFNWIQQNRTGTGVPHVPKDLGRILNICYPIDIEIQQKIAKVLSTVDNLIEKTQSLIEKYTAIKKGMMADLFTRGIDMTTGQLRPRVEDAPELYKQTELGWVPKEWGVCVLGGKIAKIDSGWSPVCDNEMAQLDEWGVLKTTAVVWGGYKDVKNKRLPLNLKGLNNVEVKNGDLLVTRKGPMDRVGVVVHVNKTRPKLMFPDTVFRFRVNADAEMTPEFAALCLGSFSVQLQWDIRKIGLAEAQVNINHGIVNKTLIPLPHPIEQEAMILSLASMTEKIATESKLLSKYRLKKKGLMQDLLTGKVAVNI